MYQIVSLVNHKTSDCAYSEYSWRSVDRVFENMEVDNKSSVLERLLLKYAGLIVLDNHQNGTCLQGPVKIKVR